MHDPASAPRQTRVVRALLSHWGHGGLGPLDPVDVARGVQRVPSWRHPPVARTAGARVARGLLWRYAAGTYVWRRVSRRVEADFHAGRPIRLPPPGYVCAVLPRGTAVDDPVAFVAHDGTCVRLRPAREAEGPPETVPPGPLAWRLGWFNRCVVGDGAVGPWRLYALRTPGEWNMARTSDGPPAGFGRWWAIPADGGRLTR